MCLEADGNSLNDEEVTRDPYASKNKATVEYFYPFLSLLWPEKRNIKSTRVCYIYVSWLKPFHCTSKWDIELIFNNTGRIAKSRYLGI